MTAASPRYRTVNSNPAKSGKPRIKFQREKTMKVCRFGLALALSCATWGAARAEISDNVVRVGVLNDISGIFQDTNGMGSVEAARMAAEDFNGGGKGIKVEIVYADHQNKADVGSAIVAQMARCRWRRCRGRRAELGRRPHHQFAAARYPHDVPRVIDRQFRPDRQGLLAQHHPMGQRCLGDRQFDRGGDDGARRQGMVFYHGQFRARPGHRGRGHQLHRKAWRQGAGLGQASAQHGGFCVAVCCRRRIPRPR